MNDFGKKLKKILIDKDMTQKELAERMNADFRSVNSWCNGNYLPSTQALKELCETLHISADYLLGIKNGKNKVEEKY